MNNSPCCPECLASNIDGQSSGCWNPTCPCHQSPCCQKCNKFAVNIGDTNLCFNPACECHSNSQEKKCPHGVWGTGCAVCFNEDRTPVHPRQPSEAWEKEIDTLYLTGTRNEWGSFIEKQIAEAREDKITKVLAAHKYSDNEGVYWRTTRRMNKTDKKEMIGGAVLALIFIAFIGSLILN